MAVSKSGRIRLYVEVDADQTEEGLKKAQRALDKFDSSTTKTTRTQEKASRTTKGLDDHTRRLGGSMLTAAKYAAGAAAAYISIGQAKDAIETTQDLAKTTAGLHRNLGLSNREGSRWAAIAKSRDIDTKSLNLSFTTLSRRLQDARDATSDQAAQLHELGLSQKDIEAANKDFSGGILNVADAFGNLEGGTKRQALAQQLLGRGYQSILPLFSEGSKSLKEQEHWADKYGATLSGKTVKAQMEAVNSARESKVAMLGLKTSFTTAVTPALEDAEKKFQGLAAIMADDKLSDAEKFHKIGNRIGNWADDAEEAFVEILPDIAEHAGEAAPRIAKALVEGFMDAPVMGKLALGAWFIHKLGGAGAMVGIGKTLGGKLFGGMFGKGGPGGVLAGGAGDLASPGATPAHPAYVVVLDQAGGGLPGSLGKGGILSKLPPLLPMGGGFATVGAVGSIIAAYEGFKSPLGHNIADTMKATPSLAGASDKDIRHELKVRPQDTPAYAMFLAEAKARKLNIADEDQTLKERRQAWQDFQDKARDIAKKGGDDQKQVLGHTWDSILGIDDKGRDRANKVHDDMRDHAVNAARSMSNKVPKSVWDMVNASGSAFRALNQKVNRELTAFGVKAVSFDVASGAKDIAGDLGHQRGGPIPGFQTGDVIPAMLEPGEFVLNRNAVAALGLGNVHAINSAWPRFQRGGAPKKGAGGRAIAAMTAEATRVDQQDIPYVWGGSHGTSPTPPNGPFDCSSAVSHILQTGGYNIPTMVSGQLANWGAPGPGKVSIYANAEHVIMGILGRLWGTSRAENPGGGPGWLSSTDPAAYMTGPFATRHPTSLGGQVPSGAGFIPHLARLLMKGPSGAIRSAGQGALNRARGAALHYLKRHASPMGGNANVPGMADAVRATGGGWHTVGATYEGLTGAHTAGGTIGGMNFAELLVAGANAGLRDQDISATLGLPNGQYGSPFGTPILVRSPGSKKAYRITKNDNGSGQLGNPFYKLDLQDAILDKLGKGRVTQTVEAKRFRNGGFVGFQKGGTPWSGGTTAARFSGSGVGAPILSRGMLGLRNRLDDIRDAEHARATFWGSNKQWEAHLRQLRHQEQRTEDLIAAMKENTRESAEVRKEMKDLNRSRRRTDALTDAELDRAIGDRVGQTLGLRVSRRSRTAGDGTQGSFGVARA